MLESFVELYVFMIGFQLECLLHQFRVVGNYWRCTHVDEVQKKQFRVIGNYWRCIPVDEVQKKLCHARQGSKTIWDLKMGQKLSSLK